MANSLGALIVSLGLDAAEFTSGLTKAEYQANQFADSLSNKVAYGVLKAEAAMELFKKGTELAFEKIPDLIKEAGKFQELAEKTGASAEALASMAAAAKAGGTDMEALGLFSIKLTKNLAKVTDDSHGAGAAVRAIGLSFKEFKALSPDAQIDALSKALSKFQDDAGKPAVLENLAKGGAQMLPVLKQLSDGIGRIKILTDEQIKTANEWSIAHERNKAVLNAYSQALAIELVPALTVFSGAMTAAIKELLGMDKAAGDLKNGHAVRDFGLEAARSMAVLADGAFAVAQSVILIGRSYGIAGAIAGAVGRGEFRAAVDLAKEARAEGEKMKFSLGLQDKVEAGIAKLQSGKASGGEVNALTKPKINTAGLATDAGANAEELLKKQLEGQIKAINLFAAQQKAGYEFANQYLKGVYDDGLTSLSDFFDKQKAIRSVALQAEIDAQDKIIAAEQAFKAKALKPQERQDADNKIAEARAKRAEAILKYDQQEILSTQENARAVKALAFQYYDFLAGVKNLQGDAAGASALKIAKQQQDAQELLTKVGFDPAAAQAQAEAYGKLLTLTEGLTRAQTDYGRLVESAGVAEKNALLDAQASGVSEVETLTRIGAIRQDALGGLAAMVQKARELADALGTPEARLFAEKLALQFRQAAAEADPVLLKIRDIGREMGDAIGGEFENALLAKGVTIRQRFVNLVEGIATDVTKTLTHNLITKPLGDWLSNVIGGNGQASGGGGLLAGLFGKVAGGGAGNTAQEAFRASEIAAENAATTALTASMTTGTSAVTLLAAAANSAAAALQAISSSSFAGGGAGGLSGLFGSGAFGSLSPSNGAFLNDAGFLEAAGSLGFATGGVALPGSIHRVNENGPELLDVNGKSYLMSGAKRLQVTPLAAGGGGGTVNNYVSVAMPAGGSRQTAMQFGRDVARQLALAQGRNG